MSSALRTEAALSCIVQDDRDIRAFVATLPDSAEREAQASDMRHAAERSLGPLDGVPFAVKGNIAGLGLPTQSGTNAFDIPAPADLSRGLRRGDQAAGRQRQLLAAWCH